MSPTPPPTVLWTRSSTASSRSWQPWAIGAALALCGCGGFASCMARDPGSLGFMAAGFVALVAAILAGPWLLDKARSHDRELILDGTTLRCGRQPPVPTADLSGWIVRTGSNEQVGTNGPNTRVPWLRLDLRHADGRSSSFAWSYPRDEDAQTLRAAMTVTFGPEAAG